MSYTPYVWHDGTDGGTLVTAARLNALEQGIADAGAGSPLVIAPPATGVAATDTANLLAAISAAQADFTDLYLPGGQYTVTSPITWNANRGSLYGLGDVTLDFATATFTGPALTIRGNPTATENGELLPHAGTRYRLEGFKLAGPDTDAGTIDGILFTDSGIGIDMVTVRHLTIAGFRDGVTYGTNTWSQSLERCFITASHRYGVNLTCGANSGEATTFLNTSIGGTRNASGTGTAIYAPITSNIDFRMIGGSLDYNDLEGDFRMGALVFIGVHVEDRNTGPMFRYTATNSATAPLVEFRDCHWSSTATAARDHIHEIAASTADGVTINFDGVRGGVAGPVDSWIVDNSGQKPVVTVTGWGISSGNAANMAVGQSLNLLTNGTFDVTSTFVAAPGVRGWYPSTPAFMYSPTNTGNGVRIASQAPVTGTAQQRVPVGATRRPLRVQGKLATTAYTAGSIGLYTQFVAEDGTTAVGAQQRIGSDVSSNTGGTSWTDWAHNSARLLPPPGAAYLTVILNASGFNGTGYWDNIEVVPV